VNPSWPDIPFKVWQQTCSALQLYCQIVGKYRLARTPWVNHSWHATFYVTARGLTTSLIPDASGIEIIFDFISNRKRTPANEFRFRRAFVDGLKRNFSDWAGRATGPVKLSFPM
jgi:hypothetical protein